MPENIYPDILKRIKDSAVMALPQSVVRILELSDDPGNGPPEYAVPISVDPGLTIQVLKFVNSSFFGFRHRITTVQNALSLVSVQTIKNFVLWNAIVSMVPDLKCGPFGYRIFNQDSLRRGAFAKVFAATFPNLDNESLFVNAMLQDIAILSLAQCFPGEYETILETSLESGKRLSALEEAELGWNHAKLGAMLAKDWGFGESFADAIENHIAPMNTINPEKGNLESDIVALSSFLPSVLDEHWLDADNFFTVYNRFFTRTAIQHPGEIFAGTDALVADLFEVAQITPPPISLVEYHKRYLGSFEF